MRTIVLPEWTGNFVKLWFKWNLFQPIISSVWPARWITRRCSNVLFSGFSFFTCISSLFLATNQNEEPVFSKDCNVFLTTVPLKQGDQGTFNHITMISNRVKLPHTQTRRLSFIQKSTLSAVQFFTFFNRWRSQVTFCSNAALYDSSSMMCFFIFPPPSPKAEAASVTWPQEAGRWRRSWLTTRRRSQCKSAHTTHHFTQSHPENKSLFWLRLLLPFSYFLSTEQGSTQRHLYR